MFTVEYSFVNQMDDFPGICYGGSRFGRPADRLFIPFRVGVLCESEAEAKRVALRIPAAIAAFTKTLETKHESHTDPEKSADG